MIDDFNREGLTIDVDFSLPAERVTRALDQVIEWRGKPLALRSDNGLEYISETLQQVQDYATRWLWTYNHERSNITRGGITPIQKLALAT